MIKYFHPELCNHLSVLLAKTIETGWSPCQPKAGHCDTVWHNVFQPAYLIAKSRTAVCTCSSRRKAKIVPIHLYYTLATSCIDRKENLYPYLRPYKSNTLIGQSAVKMRRKLPASKWDHTCTRSWTSNCLCLKKHEVGSSCASQVTTAPLFLQTWYFQWTWFTFGLWALWGHAVINRGKPCKESLKVGSKNTLRRNCRYVSYNPVEAPLQ